MLTGGCDRLRGWRDVRYGAVRPLLYLSTRLQYGADLSGTGQTRSCSSENIILKQKKNKESIPRPGLPVARYVACVLASFPGFTSACHLPSLKVNAPNT